MKTFYSVSILYFLFCCVSCSQNSHEDKQPSDQKIEDVSKISPDLDKILQIGKTQNSKLDFEKLLNDGVELKTLDVRGVLDSGENIVALATNSNIPINKIPTKDLEAETAFKNLEVNSLEHQRSIEDLRLINHKKDQTIASLSLLNDELISEIKRIKGKTFTTEFRNVNEDSSNTANLGSLKSEIKKLKNNLALKSEELKSLRYRNDSLEGRISQLESGPKVSNSDLLPKVSKIRPTGQSLFITTPQKFTGNCNLQFEAVVTSLNGKSKEAFYTEFFVLPYDLEYIIRKGGIELNDYPGIDTYAELWARSRKNSFLFPDIHKNIRALLLDFEDNGEGKRIRTDVDGSASISGLKSGKYYVIGTASLGKIGVTWSVPVSLKSGNNKISLTLANCSWSL